MTSNAAVQGEADADHASADGRSAVAIVASLWEKVESLVQLEMKLGLAEAADKLDALKRELYAKAVAGAIVFAGTLALVGAIVAALALAMPLWLGAALTGTLFIVSGVLLLRRPLPLAVGMTEDKQTSTPLSAATATKEDIHGTI